MELIGQAGKSASQTPALPVVAKNAARSIGYNNNEFRRGPKGKHIMIGARIGSWILERELGRGGMGCVYLAHRSEISGQGSEISGQGSEIRDQRSEARDPKSVGDASLTSDLRPLNADLSAIKVLAPELAVDSGFLARFQREIDILRQLDHPNIVRFRESGQQNGRPYFVMEYVPGPSCERVLEQRGRLPWTDVLDLALQVAPALKHAHDRGVIHRDLKPSNLLLAPQASGEQGSLVKLTDFGIASLFASTHLTVTGGIIGTAEYLSPEQAAGKPVSRRSDLYSLGVVLYVLLTGRTPFQGDPVDLLHKHRFAQFDRPIRLVPEIPHDLDVIVCDLLEKEPSDRPADGIVLFRRLDSFKRKLAYQATHAYAKTAEYAPGQPAPRPQGDAEGPATLMSRLMRQELEHQRTGGPIRQFFNRPWVLLGLFLVTVALIVWALWPVSAETMYQRGAVLMASQEPSDWETAWDNYLGPLLANHPDTPHRAEVETMRVRYESAKAARQSQRAARSAGPMSEAQWFYQEGVRWRQQGDEVEARRLWKSLTTAFKNVPSEEAWVRLAEKELEKADDKTPPNRQWAPVRQALEQARQLRQEGREKEAAAIRSALRELYRGDKQAEAILNEPEAGGPGVRPPHPLPARRVLSAPASAVDRRGTVRDSARIRGCDERRRIQSLLYRRRGIARRKRECGHYR
jgi:serine/threonine protein kinase